MRILGDIHGDFDWYETEGIKGCSSSIQVGDMGIGFPVPDHPGAMTFLRPLSLKHRFIYGNHDNPTLAIGHPNCLGSYGYLKDLDLFFISGGFSIDARYRVPDISWWENEELSITKLSQMINLFRKSKPRFVVSHEPPMVAQYAMFPETRMASRISRTQSAFQSCLKDWEPEQWFFGHFHVSVKKKYGKTLFSCIGERKFIEIEEIPDFSHPKKDEVCNSVEVKKNGNAKCS